MTMYDPHESHPVIPAVMARLDVAPSEALKKLVEPLYRPSIIQKRLANLALKSKIGVPLEQLPAQRYIYRDPTHPEDNSIQEFFRYQREDVHAVVGHQLPILSHLDVLRNDQGWLRLGFRAGLNWHEQAHLSKLAEFHSIAEASLLEVTLDIAPTDVIPNDAMLRSAVNALRSILGVGHPARRAIPESKRYVDPDHYHVSVSGKDLLL